MLLIYSSVFHYNPKNLDILVPYQHECKFHCCRNRAMAFATVREGHSTSSLLWNWLPANYSLGSLNCIPADFVCAVNGTPMSHSVSWAQFLPHQNFNRCSVGANAPLCLRILCWKIRMLQCNKRAVHNVVMSSYLISVMLGTILIGHQLYKLFLHHCWKGADYIEITYCYSCQLRYVWVVLDT